MACGRGASRCRRPHARGDVLCTEPGRSHPCPERHAGPAHEGNSRTMSVNADEKSDEGMVPMKQPNKEGSPSAEAVEGRTSPEGNGDETTAARTPRRNTASSGLDAVRRAARQSKSVRFTALLHHITVRRVYIPKPGKTEKRPLGVPTVSDRALQRSTAEVLSAIYEQDFLPCSFGGRPGLGAHRALATLNEVIAGGKIEWVLEADLKNFFGSLDHEWVLRFVEHRVGDPRVINLIRRWLKAGVLEDGAVHPSDEGTPQGGSISVLLSNLYLHHGASGQT